MKADPVLLVILADLFVSLAAGWFGAALIVPNISRGEPPFNFILLTVNLLAGTFSMMVAFRLRKLAKEEK